MADDELVVDKRTIPFRNLVHHCPLTYQEISEVADTSHNTARRWATGQSSPGWDQAVALLDAVESRAADLLDRVQEARKGMREYLSFYRKHYKRKPRVFGSDARYRRTKPKSTPPEIEASAALNGTKVGVTVDEETHSANVRQVPGTVVYFLIEGDEIVYVGHSSSPYWRVGHHARTKDFDRWAYIEVEADAAKRVERALIADLDPKHNRR